MKKMITMLLSLSATIAVVASNEVGRRAETIPLPIKYWIEDVAFSSDKNISVIDVDKYDEDKRRCNTTEEKKSKDETKTTEKGLHADWSVTTSASGGTSLPSGKIVIEGGVGGGYKKNDRVIEHEQGMSGYVDTNTRSGRSTRTTTAQLQGPMLRFTLIFKNIATNEQTFTFFSEATQYSGMLVKSLDDSNKFREEVPSPHSFKLIPGGVHKIKIAMPITAENDIDALKRLTNSGALGNSIDLELTSQFCLKDNTGKEVEMTAPSISVYWDFPKQTKDRRRYFINGDKLTYGVLSERLPAGKFCFSNGVLDKVFGYNFGKFDKDQDGVYIILAKVNNDPSVRLFRDTDLSQEDSETELRFVRIGTGELLRNRANYSSGIKAKCLAYIEDSLNKTVEISANDLLNATKLAREEKDYLRYAHFLSSMSDESRKIYLESPGERQSAIELAIMADNAEYFAKLYSLEWDWGNTNRTMLGFAAEKGSTNIVKWLLEKAPEGKRPRQIVDGLVDGAKEDDVDRGQTPLYLAGKNGHFDVCRYLVSKGADINRKFYVPGKKKKEDVWTQESYISDDRIRNFIKAQREVCELEDSWWRSRKPNVSVEDMRRWVEDGVLPNSYLGFHWNLLSWAIELKDVALVKSLIDKGADVNGEYSSTPNEKRTALMLACEVGDTNLVAKLMGKRANLYAHQDTGMSAFNYAIKSKKYDCAEMLLDKLDPAKCSLVEDDDEKLNLFEYVGKYCDNEEFCKKVKAKHGDAWLNMLVSLHGMGFRECLDRCALSEQDAEELLSRCPYVQMADDLYARGHLREYLKNMPEGKREYLQESNPMWIDCFNFLELREKAERGDVESLNKLGKRYGQGDGVAKDLRKAFNNFRKAAEAAEGKHAAKACYNLSVCYSEGLGTPRDEDMARHWMQEAVKRGFKK